MPEQELSPSIHRLIQANLDPETAKQLTYELMNKLPVIIRLIEQRPQGSKPLSPADILGEPSHAIAAVIPHDFSQKELLVQVLEEFIIVLLVRCHASAIDERLLRAGCVATLVEIYVKEEGAKILSLASSLAQIIALGTKTNAAAA